VARRAGATLSTAAGNATAVTSGAWVAVAVSNATAPAGAAYCNATIAATGTAGVYLDDFQLNEGAAVDATWAPGTGVPGGCGVAVRETALGIHPVPLRPRARASGSGRVMQSASSNFTQEASGGNVVWAKPRVFADWDRTGYLAAGSIDDLSDQVGDAFTIVHTLDDGLPDDVSLATTQDAVTLDLPLAYGRGNRASQYFSPYNGGSPVSGFDRDVAPVKLDWGLVTSAGQEFIRIFTGQMTNLRTRGQAAEMVAQSATRLKLMKLIQPPAVDAEASNLTTSNGGPGMNGTWPVSYALAKCGLYVSPPPRSGCRLWMPMHGSLTPFIPDANDPTANATAPGSTGLTAAGATTLGTPNWQTGPFLMSTADFVTAAESKRTLIYRVGLGTGSDILSQAGNAGRVEFWIKGDAAETVSPPGGAGSVPWLAGFDFKSTTAVDVQAGVGTDRKVYVTVNDGAGHVITLKSPTTLATDGAWYFVGAAWDIANKKLWVDHNGTVTTTAAPTLVTTSLPDRDTFDSANLQPSWSAHLPVAEVQVTGGAQANPDLVPWLADTPFTPQATVRPSFLELGALIETVPREAWEFISSLAQAELAMIRTDELDVFQYLPMSYWAESAQQAIVDLYSTSLNAQDIDVDADPTKIFNVVSVSYTDTRTDRIRDVVYRATTLDPLPPGTTVRQLALTDPVTFIEPALLTAYSNADAPFANDTYFTLNTAPDGSGTFATQSQVSAQLTKWSAGMAEITFTNSSGTTLYFVNGANAATLQIGGLTATTATGSATARDDASVAARGERALTVSLPAIQRASDALAVATELVGRLARPRKSIGAVPLFPDPRRQPGDLVSLTDAVNTGASGLWRVQSITHDRSGADYTQQALVNEAFTVALNDISVEGNCIVGP
jgi:hypothetical protein